MTKQEQDKTSAPIDLQSERVVRRERREADKVDAFGELVELVCQDYLVEDCLQAAEVDPVQALREASERLRALAVDARVRSALERGGCAELASELVLLTLQVSIVGDELARAEARAAMARQRAEQRGKAE